MVVVAKFEDNKPRTKKVIIQVQVCGRQRQRQQQRRQDYNNTSTFLETVELKNVSVDMTLHTRVIFH
jgi:hypothetical protein